MQTSRGRCALADNKTGISHEWPRNATDDRCLSGTPWPSLAETEKQWSRLPHRGIVGAAAGEDVLTNEIGRVGGCVHVAGAAADLLNPNIIARDLGLKDVATHEHTSPDGSMTPKSAIDASKLSTSALAEILAAQDQSEK